jgi:hypothetical protein
MAPRIEYCHVLSRCSLVRGPPSNVGVVCAVAWSGTELIAYCFIEDR